MSGHSKWSTIKRKKGTADAKRGVTFTKYANAIALAAKEGADPNINFKLRLAIDGARSVNMPIASVEKAIARGSGQLGADNLEEIVYEGYGPGGIAVLVTCVSDNRNRTASEVRSVFTKYGGRLAEPGAVSYQFTQRGVIQLETDDSEDLSLSAIDAGAVDVEVDDKAVFVYTEPKNLMSVKEAVVVPGTKLISADLSFVPTNIESIIDPETAHKVINFVERLELLDSVINVFTNFDIPSTMLEELG